MLPPVFFLGLNPLTALPATQRTLAPTIADWIGGCRRHRFRNTCEAIRTRGLTAETRTGPEYCKQRTLAMARLAARWLQHLMVGLKGLPTQLLRNDFTQRVSTTLCTSHAPFSRSSSSPLVMFAITVLQMDMYLRGARSTRASAASLRGTACCQCRASYLCPMIVETILEPFVKQAAVFTHHGGLEKIAFSNTTGAKARGGLSL